MTQIKDAEQQIYSIINQHIQARRISLRQFWSSDRLCIPLQSFIQKLASIGIKDKRINIKKFQQAQLYLISLQHLIEGVNYWKLFQQNIGMYLSKASPKPMKKHQQIQQLTEDNKVRSMTNNSNLYYTNKNKKFLNDYAKKQMYQKIKLNNTLRNVKNQSNYQLSMKVGELNDICTKLKNGTTYYIQTNKNGKVQIFVNQKGKADFLLTQHQFQSSYERLRLEIMNKVQQTEGTLEEDLKKVLVEIMCLSSQMKQQIKLLQQKGISH